MRCSRIIAVLAVILALPAGAANAGSVTYDFVVTNGLPDAVAAILVFSSPASDTHGWSTTDPAIKVQSFELLDGNLGRPTGFYTSQITRAIRSVNGSSLDYGTIVGTSGTTTLTATFTPGPLGTSLRISTGSRTLGAGKSINGRCRWPPRPSPSHPR